MEDIMEYNWTLGYTPNHWLKLHRTNSLRIDDGVVGQTNGPNMWRVGANPGFVGGYILRCHLVRVPISRSSRLKPLRAISGREKSTCMTSKFNLSSIALFSFRLLS